MGVAFGTTLSKLCIYMKYISSPCFRCRYAMEWKLIIHNTSTWISATCLKPVSQDLLPVVVMVELFLCGLKFKTVDWMEGEGLSPHRTTFMIRLMDTIHYKALLPVVLVTKWGKHWRIQFLLFSFSCHELVSASSPCSCGSMSRNFRYASPTPPGSIFC